ncbi:GNAT family N-acetyltransferase [Tissierella carlieri]|uniref:GNAT family N-acetyltransferase n=1 Tax=Tissierella carlieri TaxID=689904 RepID=UPI001C0FB9DD|nr:GNAT family N-acetyltransferase [Tissierella carlieri]MBU5313798.1 GNAT family N-acetyltransferase [Tissierella carlieri]
MIDDIYEQCPTYTNGIITLRQTILDDAEELLICYSDERSVPFFNSDNCNGDDFHYISIERMKQAIDFWDYSYKNKYFVRWTIFLNDTQEKIGTIEMFHRIADDEFNHYGVLRIDLQSNYEKQKYIDDILEIVSENFFKAFNVKFILTKAIPNAIERIASLVRKGYLPLNKKFVTYDYYFIRENTYK